MAEKKEKDERRYVPISIVEPSEDELNTFYMRSAKLRECTTVKFKQVDIVGFFETMFRRPGDTCWPFQSKKCDEWKRIRVKRKAWLHELKNWQKRGGDVDEFIKTHKIDYSDIDKHVYNPLLMIFEAVKGEDGQYALNEDGDVLTLPKRFVVTTEEDDITKLNTTWLERCQGSLFCITSPILFNGWNRGLKNAQRCFGIGIDLDYVSNEQYMNEVINNLTKEYTNARKGGIYHRWWPEPNIITNSGHGLHIYFLFKTPVDIHTEDQQKVLKKLKYGLIERIWNSNAFYGVVSEKSDPSEIQYQGITQGFRPPGTLTKFQKPVESFAAVKQVYHSVAELNEYIAETGGYKLDPKEVHMLENGKPYDPTKTKLSVAKEKYPTWYHERIELGLPPKKWNPERRLYDFIVRMITDPAAKITVGHRYSTIRALAIFAAKCNVPFDEMKKIAMGMVPQLKSLAYNKETEFKDSDVEKALESYYDKKVLRSKWETLIKNCGLTDFYGANYRKLTAEQKKAAAAKRRDQKTHLARARLLQQFDDPEGKWRENNGRPFGSLTPAENSTQAQLVRAWRIEHPDCLNKSQCVKDIKAYIESLKVGLTAEEQDKKKVFGTPVSKLHIGRNSVIKWWEVVEDEQHHQAEQDILDDITNAIDAGRGWYD